MKTIITAITIILSLISTINAQEHLDIDTSKSEVKWFGEYTFYFGGHDGTIDFKEGYFIKKNDMITGGEFIIDMESILCLDIENDEAKEGLVSHLKDSDFFEVEKYKTAKLVITSVSYHDATRMKIHADLTIKDITLPINFQAEVNFEKQEMTTKFKIDRQRWGVDYTSKFKDGAISDGIGFKVKLSL